MQSCWFETPRRLMEIEPLCTWLNNNYVKYGWSDGASNSFKWEPEDFKKDFVRIPGIWVLYRNVLKFLTEKENAKDIKEYKGFLPQLDFTSLVFHKTTRRGWYYSSHSHPLCTEVIYS